jgi:type VI secretion system secreted protein Hcp
MSTISLRLTRIAVSAVLAGGVAAALVLPSGGVAARLPVTTPPTDFWTAFSLASAQADTIYFVVDGFTGDSTSEAHPNAVTATQVDSGVNNSTNPLSGTGGGAAKPVPQQLIVTKGIDIYTPQLNRAANQGARLPNVSLFMSKAGETPTDFFEIDATDAVIQAQHVQVATGKDSAELVKFAYTKIRWTYYAQNSDGGTVPKSSCWDFKTNKDCTNDNT